MSPNRVIVITGPTATGKSALGVKAAAELDGEIVSADSMQVYKCMDIGTAKPTCQEMCGIPHHLIDFVPPDEDYSVAQYINNASKCIDDIFSRGKQPLLVGGTGLYIDSLLSGRSFSARGSKTLRSELEKEFDTIGGEAMLHKLHEIDPESAANLHSNDKKRIVRAIEVYTTTGKTISAHDKETRELPPRYNSLKVALTFSDREELYRRIDNRVDTMIKNGLEAEVLSLLEMGISRKNTSMQAIGYKELSEVLGNNAKKSDIDTAIDIIKMESRRYAKRQLTWLRRDIDVNWITWDSVPDFDRGLNSLMGLLNETK